MRVIARHYPAAFSRSERELSGRPATVNIIRCYALLWGGIATALIVVLAIPPAAWVLDAPMVHTLRDSLWIPGDRYGLFVTIFAGFLAMIASLPLVALVWLRVVSWLGMSDDEVASLSGMISRDSSK
jgi:hypothetical protein